MVCYGENQFGQSSVPSFFNKNIFDMALSYRYSCAVIGNEFGHIHCFGSDIDAK